jgi:hypothetical protein
MRNKPNPAKQNVRSLQCWNIAKPHKNITTLSQGFFMVFFLEKGELLFEINEKATARTVKEFSEDGAKFQYNAEGQVAGKYFGKHIETVDIVLKRDGSNQWEIRAIDFVKDGTIVMFIGKGTGKQGGFQGEISYMTGSKELAWLNFTEAWMEGTANLMTNETAFKIYSTK